MIERKAVWRCDSRTYAIICMNRPRQSVDNANPRLAVRAICCHLLVMTVVFPGAGPRYFICTINVEVGTCDRRETVALLIHKRITADTQAQLQSERATATPYSVV